MKPLHDLVEAAGSRSHDVHMLQRGGFVGAASAAPRRGRGPSRRGRPLTPDRLRAGCKLLPQQLEVNHHRVQWILDFVRHTADSCPSAASFRDTGWSIAPDSSTPGCARHHDADQLARWIVDRRATSRDIPHRIGAGVHQIAGRHVAGGRKGCDKGPARLAAEERLL